MGCCYDAELGVQRFAGSRLFARWFVYGVYAAVACVFLPLYGLGWAFGANPNEKTVLSVRFAGTAVFWSIIVVSAAASRVFVCVEAAEGRAGSGQGVCVNVVAGRFQVCNLILVPYLHTWFWFIWAAVLLNFAFWFISVGVCPVIPGEFCPDLAGALQATHVLPRYHLSVILACFVALLPPFLYWFHQVGPLFFGQLEETRCAETKVLFVLRFVFLGFVAADALSALCPDGDSRAH